jgi:hypothetical protein
VPKQDALANGEQTFDTGPMASVINPTSLTDVVQLTRPVTLARDQVVSMLDALHGLLPDGGLPRGSTVIVDGVGAATSLALAVAAGPSAAGGWVAVVGRDDLGLAAAAEAGIVAERLALVAEPPADQWATVVAALIGAVDVIVVGSLRVRAADARRLASRARERGTVLVQAGTGRSRSSSSSAPGLEADLRLTVVASHWQGIGAGHGHLQARRVTVEATGRRRASRPRRAELWLPNAQGRITTAGVAVSPVSAVPGVSYAGADIDRLVDPLGRPGSLGEVG